MLYFQENFLSKKCCDEIIGIYNYNIDKTFQYEKTQPLCIFKVSDILISEITEHIIQLCQFFTDQKIRLDNAEIVKWPNGAYQNEHYDTGDIFSAIIYLNDNYDGGRTCFQIDDIKIHPKTGKCLIFSNGEYMHWVEPVMNGDRYTLIYWFKKE